MVLALFSFTPPVVIEAILPNQITQDNFQFTHETGNLIIVSDDLKSVSLFQPLEDSEFKAEISPDFRLAGDYSIASLSELYIEGKDYLLFNISDWADGGAIKSFLLPAPYEVSQYAHPVAVLSEQGYDFNVGIRNLDQVGDRFFANTLFLESRIINNKETMLMNLASQEVAFENRDKIFVIEMVDVPLQQRTIRLDSVSSVNTAVRFSGSAYSDDLLMLSALESRIRTFGYNQGEFARSSIDVELKASAFKPVAFESLKKSKTATDVQAWWDSFSKFQGATEIEPGIYLTAYTTPNPLGKGADLVLETIDRSGQQKRLVQQLPGAFFLSANSDEAYVLEVNPETGSHHFLSVSLR
jgi:hypothetical protein